MRLAFAATAHKFQGQTVQKPMCLVVEPDQSFIVEKLPVDKLKPSNVALKEVNQLKEITVLHMLDDTADNSLTGDFRLARPH